MIRVALLDDHKVILDGMNSILSMDEEIMVCGQCETPGRAFELLDQEQVDILLTDLDMPEMNGRQVLEVVKSKHPHTKVIVLSMHNEHSVIKELMELGADGYLVKSAGKEEILSGIHTVYKGIKFFSNEAIISLTTSSATITQTNKDERLSDLTKREIEILKLTAEGLSSKQIGETLFISPRTVETHRNNLMKKLELNGLADLIRFAFKTGLIE